MRALAIILALAAGCDERRPAKPASSQARSAPAAAPAPRIRTAPPVRETPWTRAEAQETAEAWDLAAAAYERERARCAERCLEIAHTVVLARKNALLASGDEPPPPGDEPPPLPPRVRAVIDALDEYVALAEPTDPQLAGMKFLAASATWKWRQPDAIARLEAVLREHRDAEVAEYAANQLLDLLMRAGRIAELKEWVAILLDDAAFLAGKDQLRATLERLRGL